MPRVALVTVDEATRTCIESVLAGGEFVPLDSLGAAANRGCNLAVVGTRGDLDVDALARLTSVCPVLIVASGREPVPADAYDLERTAAIRAPFELFDLRAKIDGLLAAPPLANASASQAVDRAAATAPQRHPDSTTRFPAVPHDAAAVLDIARRSGVSLWIAGPPGSGCERVATELLEQCEFSIVRRDEPLVRSSTVVVSALEERSRADQHRIAGWLSDRRGPRVIALSAANPSELAAAGRIDSRLYHALAGLVAHLPPLRERAADIADLTRSRSTAIAARLQLEALEWTAGAQRRLAAYPWPGNLAEFDAVLTRTMVGAKRRGNDVVDADDVLLAPDFSHVTNVSAARSPAGEDAADPNADAADRGGPDSSAGRAATATREPAANVVRLDVHRGRALVEDARESAVEPLVAGLAHELRNPLATIKTFASLSVGEESEQAELARLAVAACDRLDRQLDVLGRYAEADAGGAQIVDLADVFESHRARRADGFSMRILCDEYRVRLDAELAGVIVDLLLDEIAARLPAGRSAVLARPARGASGLELAAPVEQGAERHLQRHVGDAEQAASWRVVLARSAAARCGAAITVDETEAMLTVRWDVAEVEEEERDESHAQSTDR